MSDQGDEQGAVIAFLSRGEAYGKPGVPVERIDTHASVVFLIEDRVYKLKRSIRYTYLDYSSEKKRQVACEAELRLNRRTAPTLYRAVRAVTLDQNGAFALDGMGPPVDWLVEMTRFPQDQLFDRLAENRLLTPAIMRELGDEIAAFHQTAEICESGGGSAGMRVTIDGNEANLRLAGDLLDRAKVDSWRAASGAALRRLASLLDRRRAGGKVRHCHGDLHLGNICLYEGKPVLFDGIEFNEAFTCIDRLYDFAFVLMDLDHRGLDALGAVLFNRYFDLSGESDGLAALPLFLSVRAAVRAHVSIAAIAQQKDGTKKRLLAKDAAAYLDSALSLLEPAKPCLIAVGGFSGSGKSTFAQTLAPDFLPVPGARLLRSDVLRKRLAGVAPETRLPPTAYTKNMTDKIYTTLYEEAAASLAAGYSAIADAAFLESSERIEIAAVAARAKVPFCGFWLEAPAEKLRERVAARTGDASDADLAVLERQLTYQLGPLDWTRLDAGGDVEKSVAAARRHLSGKDEA